MLNEPLQRAFSSLKRAAVLPDGREEQAEFSFEEILKKNMRKMQVCFTTPGKKDMC